MSEAQVVGEGRPVSDGHSAREARPEGAGRPARELRAASEAQAASEIQIASAAKVVSAAPMASELPPSPARTTTTLYSYAEKLAAEQAPRSASLLLGLRWCFGLPAPAPAALTALTEYSLPLNPLPVERALAERGGLRLVRHAGDDEAALADHLAAGKPAIVAVDAFYFSFRPAFRRVHSSRTVLVRRTGESLRLADGWLPAVETTVGRAELAAARRSSVPLDVEREPLFSGNPVGGVWFSLEVDPLEVRDAAGWMRARLACLHAEMTRARRDERGRCGAWRPGHG